MTTGSSRVVAAYNELSTGELRLGPPKSAAGRRVVALPAEIVPELTEHLATSAQPGGRRPGLRDHDRPAAAAQQLQQVGALARVVAEVGLPGPRFHDLRHTGNTLAAPFASTRELMARMGHGSSRAALIYQHATADRDRMIADALDALLAAEGQKDERPEREVGG